MAGVVRYQEALEIISSAPDASVTRRPTRGNRVGRLAGKKKAMKLRTSMVIRLGDLNDDANRVPKKTEF